MVLSPKLEMRQGQQLVMTPQLQQAIRLLQLSNIELCLFVETELERNPLLERDEAAPDPPEEAPRREEAVEEDGEGTWEAEEHSAGINVA
jgi:RNA polymerase sigma-54 factor